MNEGLLNRGVYCGLVSAMMTNIICPELVEDTAEWVASCQTYEVSCAQVSCDNHMIWDFSSGWLFGSAWDRGSWWLHFLWVCNTDASQEVWSEWPTCPPGKYIHLDLSCNLPFIIFKFCTESQIVYGWGASPPPLPSHLAAANWYSYAVCFRGGLYGNRWKWREAFR